MEEQVIKERLKRTWIPFFSRFGSLTEIQKKVIPKILEDKNLVIISPAATGKTEATVAPIVEKLLEKNKTDFSILYVSPTRALVNDLYRRLQYPFEYLNLKIEKKTGDRPRINEKKLPFILLTTPESFDSLLSRHTQIFTSLSYVILDEIHLLDNTPRGDQLRILLN
ncbi:MAG: DEAD/DEAH box helicase, partial [candidate division WOR-3 bacterium]